jgi:putative OPT family oligopeptide transporter
MSKEFRPFVPPESQDAELTVKSVVFGVFLAALFGAANAYLALKAGQTIAATIPAAVIALAAFRLPLFKGTVLEQNIARTAASVGEALIAGVAFTIPAFLLVDIGGAKIWESFRGHMGDAVWMMLAGGLLGTFFIIILRRPLCVEADLPFPEATACAEVVKAGQHTSTDAPRYLFGAMAIGALLQFFTNARGLLLFRESLGGFIEFGRAAIRHFDFDKQPIGSVTHFGGLPWATPAASPALMGIGYIIGPRLAAINFSGTAIAWWVLIPLVLFVDPDLPRRFGAAGGAAVEWDVLSNSVWYNVVRPIAVGTMLVSAVYTLYTMRESLLASFRGALASTGKGATPRAANRLEQDIPLQWVVLSIAVLIVPIAILYYRYTHELAATLVATAVMTVVGFVLAAVGGYLVGLVGSSNQPVSGLTLSALVIAALLMVSIGVRGIGGVAAVLGVASVVCIACSVAGSLTQDLKVGYVLGGTPWKMQITEVITVTVLAFFLMFPIVALHETYTIGSRDLPAPQAGLMALLSSGIVGGEMAWGLVLVGCVFGVALILIGAPAPMLIAVGMYLPFETTSAIFVGGMIKGLAEILARKPKLTPAAADAYEQRGTLLASGFIAGEALLAITLSIGFLGAQALREWKHFAESAPALAGWLAERFPRLPDGTFDISFTRLIFGSPPEFAEKTYRLALFTDYGAWLSLLVFATVAYVLMRGPLRKKLPE